MSDEAAIGDIGVATLRRLEVLVDCTYALVIVVAVAGMPTPRDVG